MTNQTALRNAMGNACAITIAMVAPLSAQWLQYRDPSVPRTKDGKPNLSAPAPRNADGKPDLSGVWTHDRTPVDEMKRLAGPRFDEAEKTAGIGMEPGTIHKYAFSLLVDLKPEDALGVMRPEAAAIMKRQASEPPPDGCGPGSGLINLGFPTAGLLAEPIKIVQAPRLTVVLYEAGDKHRQIYTDGRALPQEYNLPAYPGYSVGRWERDTFVVETAGFNDKVRFDLQTRALKNLTAGSRGDYRPAWSPDSNSIAFSSIRDATPTPPQTDGAVDPKIYTTDIYVMRRDGTSVRRLTKSGSFFSPSWSRDGKRIVCVQRQVQPTTKTPFPQNPGATIVSIDLADGQTTVLKEVRPRAPLAAFNQVAEFPQWISSSRMAYLISYGLSGFAEGEVEFSDGASAPQGEFGSPHWSVDGRQMVFHRLTSGANAGPQAPLSPLPPAIQALMTSMSAVYRSSQAFSAKPALDPHFRVTRTGMFPSSQWLGDRREVVMTGASASSIVALAPDGGSRAILDDPKRRAQFPTVSPRGDEIAFALGESSQPLNPLGPTHLALIQADGRGLRELPEPGENVGFPNWSPDGAAIVYSMMPRGRSTPENSGLRIIDLRSGRVTTLTPARIVFPRGHPWVTALPSPARPDRLKGHLRSTRSSPMVPGSPGSRWRQARRTLTRHGLRTADGSVHPRDENLIYGAHHVPGGQIFVMRADGTDVRQLTDTPAPKSLPAWLPAQLVPSSERRSRDEGHR